MSDVSAPRSAADRLLLDRRLKKRRQESSDGAATTIPRRGDDGPAPLSFAQERLWFLERLQPGTAVYNIPAVVELDGPLDAAALGAALSALVERQESLRTRIETAESVGEDGVERLRGRQRVLGAAPVTLPAVDLSALPRPAAAAEARRVQRREARQPFRLEGGELARWALVRLGGEEHLLLVTLHHAIADGWSFAILLQQLSAAYAAALGGSDPASAMPPLPVSYADFAVWQRGVLQGDELERQLAYWRRRLDGAPTRLELPTDRPRPAISGHRGGRVEIAFDEATAAGIERLASELSATPFMVLLAAWQVLLGRLAGQRDVVVGTPIANRSRVETEGMIGFFANTLAVRGDFSDAPLFAELVTRVRDQTLDDFAHQDLPFEELVAELGVERSLAHAPIFQTLFALQNAPRGNPRTAGVAWRPRSAHSATAKVDLSLTLVPAEGRYAGSFEYRRDLFDETTVRRWAGSFRTLIAAAVAAPRTRVTELPLLGRVERQRLLHEWNDTARPFPRRTLGDLFRDAAAADPQAVALAWETGDGGVGEATYAELDAASDRGARRLVAAGVVPGDAVAVAGERSPQLVEAMLSVVKAGAFYVPLDASYPADRLVFMLEDTAAKVLLADDAAAARLPAGGPPRLPLVAAEGDELPNLPDLPDLPLPRDLDPAHLAYAIYTSGSTGRPKGVAVDHRAVARLLFDSGFADLGPEQTWMLFAPISFDVSTLELWAPLVCGGRLAVPPPGRLSVRQIGESIRRLGVTSAWLTAGLFHQVVEVDVSALAPLEQLLAGGDVLSPTAVGRVLAELPGTAMINGYGPTENTTFTACHRAGPSDGDGSVPIGRPIGNSTVHLLDGRLEPVPAGVAGELYTGGCGVARGYLGRPALTAAVFLPDPYGEPGSRRYRTGDLARWRADGTLEFLGRADQQVKIRGFRVEPGEVETVLRRAPMLTGAAVAVHGRGAADKRLVGYCVAAEGEGESVGAVRAWLAERLPDFLLPAQLVFLDALPLNANGKVDRRALPEPETGDREGEHEPPAGEAEESLAALWVEVLALGDEEPVGRGDSFFRLGGHSLRATMLVARLERRLGVDVPVRLVFEHPHLADMAAALERLTAAEPAAADEPRLTAAAAEGVERAPLSFTQERLWFLDRLTPGLAVYNVPMVLVAEGDLDADRLAAALTALVERQSALRLRFAEGEDGRPWQHVAPIEPVELPLFDLSKMPEARREEEALTLARAEARRPFDLDGGPLARFALVRLAADRHQLHVTLHHAVADGWSLDVFSRELATIHANLAAGHAADAGLEALPVSYVDHAVWQRELLSGERLAARLDRWRERLAGAPALLELPTDRPRPPVVDHRGGRFGCRFDAARAAAVERLAGDLGVTPFMLLLAAFDVLLSRLSGQTDVVVGTPIAARERVETEGLIGFFANTLALRTDLGGDPSFAALVGRVRDGVLGDFASQDLPFEELVSAVAPERNMSHAPIFQVLMSYRGGGAGGAREAGGVRWQRRGAPTGTSKYDLSLDLLRADDGLHATVDWYADVFDESTVRRWMGHLERLLDAALEQPETPISQLPLLAEDERRRLLVDWNDTAQDYEGPETLGGLVARQAVATPDAPALSFGDQRLTHGELSARVRALAAELRRRGVMAETVGDRLNNLSPGQRESIGQTAGAATRMEGDRLFNLSPVPLVGVAMERSVELVVALHAVVAAGGAYVPVDPGYPEERVAFMIGDALGGGGILLTQRSLAERMAALAPVGVEVLAVDGLELPETAELPPSGTGLMVTPESAAYAIYTSGSTGQPKGAVNTHRAIRNRLLWMQQAFGIGAGDRVLQKTPFSFDVSVWELFWPLITGAELVVAEPGGHQDPGYLARTIRERGITTLHFVPSMLQVFLDEPGVEECTSLTRVIASGEALPPALVRRFHQRLAANGTRLFNLYGPTEAAIDVTWLACDEADPERVTIGVPVANTRLHVVDRHLRPQPVGVAGELLIGGVQLARGYLGRPSLTAERFVPDPFADLFAGRGDLAGDGRLYRTGDLARHLPSADDRPGEIEYLGRLDHQVKIRGLRIELGEIEAALVDNPAVREAVVLALGEGATGTRLVAYVAADVPAEPLSADSLRDALRRRLPEHMLPAAFVLLDALPTTPNGKLDRRALAALDAGPAETAEYVAPESEAERRLAAIWGELLEVERVGTGDDFFRLGGHSLLAVMVIARLRRSLGVELPVRALFEHRTLGELARHLEETTVAVVAATAEAGATGARRAAASAIPRRGGDGPAPLSFAQERLWFLDRLTPGGATYNIPLALRLTGDLDVARLGRAATALAARQASLRTRFASDPKADDPRPRQVIDPPAPFPLPLVDLAALGGGARRAAERLAGREAHRPFDLEGGALTRFTLVRVAAGEHFLFVTQHHAVSDGWSIGILISELSALYAAAGDAAAAGLAPLPIDYADFAVWQRGFLSGAELERQLAHWRRRLEGAPALLELPTDRPRPATPTHRGAAVAGSWDAAFAERVEALAADLSASPFMLLLAAWQLLLARLAGPWNSARWDVVTGVPIAARNRLETESLIGFFANTLAVRTAVDPRAGFAALVDRVRDAALDDFAHQDLPFEELVAEMKVPRSLSHSPIFQVAFSLGNVPTAPSAMPGVTVEKLRAHSGAVRFDLSLGLARHEGGYRSLVEYKTDLFDAATVERWNGHLQTLLAAALDAPETPVADLPLMTAGERRQVVVEANRTAHDFSEPALLHELVAQRAAADPAAPAISFGDQRLSYGELAERAERLARRLVALGVGAETRVAVAMHRSVDLVTALLAVLQAGGAYLPIDPDYPPGRVEHMLRDGLGRGGLLLTQGGLAEEMRAAAPDGVRVLAVDAAEEGEAPTDAPLPAVDPDSAAYVIYTSGSTGVPKGAVNRHRSIVNRLLWMRREFAVGPGDRVLHKAPFSFDVSIWEIFVPLVSGAELVIAEPGGHRDAVYLARLVAERRVTLAQFVPSLFAVFLELPQAAECRSLSRVVASGEALPPELARRFGEIFPDAALYNVYGPTETAVGVTFKRCDAASAGRMTLGQAISNVRVHVVDERLAAQPPGVVGELAIGGVQVGRGYLDRPGLTAGRFVPDPFAADFTAAGDTAGGGLAGDGRLYLTGDLARWLPPRSGPDGDERPAEIEFLGRRDQQVKLRGLRIELGEIESLLGAVEGVASAVVTLRDDGLGPRLVGYLVMAEGATAPPAAELRRSLGSRLPEFMVPADFVLLDALPTSPTGKLDRGALPAPDAPVASREHVEPQTAAEELVAGVWAEALELERVGAHDDFFELGGHSLLATMVVARLGRALDLEVPVRMVFEHPRLDALAAALEEMLIEATGWSEDDALEEEG